MKKYSILSFFILLFLNASAQDLLFWTFSGPNSFIFNKTSVSSNTTDSLNAFKRNSPRFGNMTVNPIEKYVLIQDGIQMKLINFNGFVVDSIPGSNNNFSSAFGLDVDSNVIYYPNNGTAQFQSYSIKDSVVKFLIPRIIAETIEIDEDNRTLYNNLYDGLNSRLVRFDLPLLSNQEIIYTSPVNERITDFFLSPNNNSIYFINAARNAIQKIDYDGNNLEVIHQETTGSIRYIQGDYCSNKIFFVVTRFNNPGRNSKIKQIDLSGSNERVILDTAGLTINGFAAYFKPQKESVKKDTSFCVGDSITVNYSDSTATYLWSDGTSKNSKLIKQPGVYWVDVSSENCSARDSIIVTTFPFQSQSFLGNDTIICEGDSIRMNANLPGFNYRWNNGSTSPELTIKSAGIYYLEMSDGNCPIRDSISITIKLTPKFTLGNDSALCNGDTLRPINIQGSYEYLWNTGINAHAIAPSKTGIYWLTAFENGCFETDSIYITLKDRPFIKLMNDTVICFGDSAILNSTTTVNTSYLWNTGDSSAIIIVGASGIYKITATSNGCSSSDSTLVTVLDNELLFLGNDTTLCEGKSLHLVSNISNSAYLWHDGSSNDNYTAIDSGLFTLKISNQCGEKIDSIKIGTINCECEVITPTAFTPNNDFINDQFISRINCELETYSLEIYNRWGDKVFQSAQQSQAWDGTKYGIKQKDGVYFYVLRFKAPNESLQTIKGNVLLSR